MKFKETSTGIEYTVIRFENMYTPMNQKIIVDDGAGGEKTFTFLDGKII
jgi:hypothetical protein